jgi:hypothetical protein
MIQRRTGLDEAEILGLERSAAVLRERMEGIRV